MKAITTVLIAGLVLGFSGAGLAQGVTSQCYKEDSLQSLKFCVVKTVGSNNPDILFHFHGRTMNEKAWTTPGYFPELIRNVWAQKGFQPPTVVTVSYGSWWYLVEKNSAAPSGLLNSFVEKAISAIESRIGGITGQRMLIGESMGGFNGSQVLFKLPKFFTRVALVCPAFLNISPLAADSEKEDYVRRTGAQGGWVDQFIGFVKPYVPNQAAWTSISPVERARVELNAQSPKLYVSCGSQDEFGFFEGAQKFTENALASGANVQWWPQFGKHCTVDARSVAEFLSAP